MPSSAAIRRHWSTSRPRDAAGGLVGVGERVAVAVEQLGGQRADLRGGDPHVHPAVGQVAAVDRQAAGIDAGLGDAGEHGHQPVEVVQPGVPVGQQRPRHPAAVGLAAEQPDQETARVARVDRLGCAAGLDPPFAGQPAVDVGVVQVDPPLPHLAQVGPGMSNRAASPSSNTSVGA